DEQIVWRSTGEKGHLDGAVTFHELAPRLTRILAVVEYYPQGFMEKTGNIWRAVGRRVQVEFKRCVRQVMTSTILDPDRDRQSTRLNSSHVSISYAVFCLKKKLNGQ